MKVISRYPLWSWFTYRNQSHNVDAHKWNLKEYAFLIRMAIFIQYLFAVHFAFAKLLWGVWLGRWRVLNRRACNKIYLRVGNDDRAKRVYIFIYVYIYIYKRRYHELYDSYGFHYTTVYIQQIKLTPLLRETKIQRALLSQPPSFLFPGKNIPSEYHRNVYSILA